jgi:hypothetical protein
VRKGEISFLVRGDFRADRSQKPFLRRLGPDRFKHHYPSCWALFTAFCSAVLSYGGAGPLPDDYACVFGGNGRVRVGAYGGGIPLSSEYTAMATGGRCRLVKRCIQIFLVMVLLFGVSVIVLSGPISTARAVTGGPAWHWCSLCRWFSDGYRKHIQKLFYGISFIVPPAVTEISRCW